MRVLVLTGGGGGARLCAGLARALDSGDLTIVVNTGDDERVRGLHVSPDVDTVLYYLADLVDWERGWGLQKESFIGNDAYRELVTRAGLSDDMQEWFNLGDRDIATHMFRSRLLDDGATLTQATDALRRALGVAVAVLPMSDDELRTVLETSTGDRLDFQTYFVKRRHADEITRVTYEGDAAPAPGVLAAIEEADVVILGPSNPMLSIGPILQVRRIRDAIAQKRSVAISPIVGGKAIKGPADMLLASLGHEVSCVGVARIYGDLIDAFVIDERDRARTGEIDVPTIVCDTMMPGPKEALRCAKAVLDGI